MASLLGINAYVWPALYFDVKEAKIPLHKSVANTPVNEESPYSANEGNQQTEDDVTAAPIQNKAVVSQSKAKTTNKTSTQTSTAKKTVNKSVQSQKAIQTNKFVAASQTQKVSHQVRNHQAINTVASKSGNHSVVSSGNSNSNHVSQAENTRALPPNTGGSSNSVPIDNVAVESPRNDSLVVSPGNSVEEQVTAAPTNSSNHSSDKNSNQEKVINFSDSWESEWEDSN